MENNDKKAKANKGNLLRFIKVFIVTTLIWILGISMYYINDTIQCSAFKEEVYTNWYFKNYVNYTLNINKEDGIVEVHLKNKGDKPIYINNAAFTISEYCNDNRYENISRKFKVAEVKTTHKELGYGYVALEEFGSVKIKFKVPQEAIEKYELDFNYDKGLMYLDSIFYDYENGGGMTTSFEI